MIDPEKRARIERIFRQNQSGPTEIGREVGVHHSTVSRVLREAGLEPVVKVQRPRMVDPYLPAIQKKLKEYPDIHASRLFGIVQELGYPGQPDHFRSIVAQVRPKKQAEAYLRLVTLPGEQGQVDWGHFGTLQVGRASRPLYAFVMVLSYSRQLFCKRQPESVGI
jgi:transposase